MTNTFSADTGHTHVPEALANFGIIASMYSQKTAACHSFVLSAAFHELNRLNEEVKPPFSLGKMLRKSRY